MSRKMGDRTRKRKRGSTIRKRGSTIRKRGSTIRKRDEMTTTRRREMRRGVGQRTGM